MYYDNQKFAYQRKRERAFAAELDALCKKHGMRLHNDGAGGMWFYEAQVDEGEEPGSEYCP